MNPIDADANPSGFAGFDLSPELLSAVDALGFTAPTPIQAAAIPVALSGRDMIGRARTGSGKTLAFGLPLLQRITNDCIPPQALVIAPTRELALQVTQALKSVAKNLSIRLLTIYGGTPYASQLKALSKGGGVVVGTPGRLRDLFERGALDLSQVQTLVLDEADEMLNMGFIDDVEMLLGATATSRQVLLFSASMPAPMRQIADKYLRDPVEVQVEDQALTVHHIEQQWMRVPASHKLETLHCILATQESGMALVFASTRIGCVEVSDGLNARGMKVDRLHGGLAQNLRERVLKKVRSGGVQVLVATDVAARGIDVQQIGLVVNYDIPESHERYVHRIGRTARAGRSGVAITLVTPKQKRRLREMAQALDTDIAQAEIPTNGAMLRARRAGLQDDVKQAVSSDLTHAHALVAKLTESGTRAEDVAAAALQVLADLRSVSLDTSEDDVLPEWVRPIRVGPFDSRPPENINEVELYLSVGKRRKANPKGIVTALIQEAGVAAVRIGRIRIDDHRTFVGMPRALAEEVVANRDTLRVDDRDVAIKLRTRGSVEGAEK
ncbi:MAG: DEAD/DEAH box helicase [Rhodobacterales bacterium]|nr:DEAD/DEAH box helicase [Rhodobacterales bacterium]